jgi:hypothetical protein
VSTVVVENEVITVDVNPASPITVTVTDDTPSTLTVNFGDPLELTLNPTPNLTIELEAGQGPSGVYGSSEFTIRIDQVDANTIYRGEAQPGSSESMTVWRIQRITISGGSTTVLWAGGNKNFVNRWSDRLTLSYS